MIRKILLGSLAAATLVAAAGAPASAIEDDPFTQASMLFAGLSYATKHCPDMEIVPERSRQAFADLGLDTPDDMPRDMKMTIAILMHRFDRLDPAQNCPRVWAMFGPDGTEVPGVLRKTF